MSHFNVLESSGQRQVGLGPLGADFVWRTLLCHGAQGGWALGLQACVLGEAVVPGGQGRLLTLVSVLPVVCHQVDF